MPTRRFGALNTNYHYQDGWNFRDYYEETQNPNNITIGKSNSNNTKASYNDVTTKALSVARYIKAF